MLALASLGSWLPFAIVSLLIVFVSIIFTLRYQVKKRRDHLVTFVCSTSLIISLLTASLLPTDIILVSFMKNSNGTFKEWTQNQTNRDQIQNYVEIGYYVFYGLIIAMAFLVNPFLFFFYEEHEEDDATTCKKILSAMKWTTLFLIFLIVFIVLGAFVPQLTTLPTDNSTSEWDNVKYLINHFDSSRLQDSISFAVFSLSIVGFLFLTIYTGYGSIAFPLLLIRGKQSARAQQKTIEEQRSDIEQQIQAIKSRYPRSARMPARERNMLQELEEKQLTLSRNEQSIKILRRSICFKFRFIYRPMQIIFGVLLLLLAILIFVSLLLSNINKCIHFISFKQIFAQGNKTLPNPIDIILTWTGQFYPLNYILLSLFLVYIILSSLFGLQQLGIWFLWVRMYRFSRGRTKPQAILMLCSLMMFIVVAINVFVYLIIPQYSIYGDQNYAIVSNNATVVVKQCTQFATTDDCQMTVMGRILLRFFYKVWFFGAVYFCLGWLFLFIFVISFFIKIIRARESNIQEYTADRLLEDSDDEDVPLLQ